MLKGISTWIEYNQCIKKGLCTEHSKEFNEDQLPGVKKEFPKKAFKYIRVNVLYPFLCFKSPKCETMKKVMEKTPAMAKIFIDGAKAEEIISEEAAEIILIIDSAVIFTICHLSKICCIGALFCPKINMNLDQSNPNYQKLHNLLLVDGLNNNICHLYPDFQKNFTDCDFEIVKSTLCITLLFIKKFCVNRSIKVGLENIEKDIKTNCGFDQVTVSCAEYNYKNMSCIFRRTSALRSSPYNFYSPTDYIQISEHFFTTEKYKLASFFGYLAVSMGDSLLEAYLPCIKALLTQHRYNEALFVVNYAMESCAKKHHKRLNKIKETLLIHLATQEREKKNNEPEKSGNYNNKKDKMLTNKKDEPKSDEVDLVDDSDSCDSDFDVEKYAFGIPSAAFSMYSDGSSEATEKKELKTESVEELKNKSPDCIKEPSPSPSEETKKPETESVEELENKLPDCAKESSTSQDLPKLDDEFLSDDEVEVKKKKQTMNGTKEKTKLKSFTRRKRTISEGSVDNQVEEEMDIKKINSYLREASEALLADCGYKAVQIFRGPLRKFIESSNFLSFEECDIVCIKYSYGLAYCKSGGRDDLEKCITILKDIIEYHDSITFPAAHYSLGLAFRKLNRFKEALQYLEIIQNFLDKRIHFKVYSWPGTTTVIQETKPDILKNLVEDLIKECENPPNPDAFCRYENCNFQPTIYYSDPDFKGYVSLSCSEQCNLQYHLLCWKTIKEEKKLTDKEFLEKSCFTPDCEGFIIKIQNIDKKGDLSKEFVSEFKKPQKLPKKWDKKQDTKEKKKKKTIVKSEGGSQEILTENAKDRSRKSSVCGSEILENKKDHSRESSVCDNETNSQVSGSSISNEEVSCKSESSKKSLDCVKQQAEIPSSSSNCISSSVPEDSYSNYVEEAKKICAQLEESKAELDLTECIKNNAYSYMADFLQYHGPLRIDDPLLTNELQSFPEKIYNIISKVGIGEFLKNDLRFAFVGDLYVCIIDDVAKAYQMLSLPTDFKNLESLDSHEDSKYYCENGKTSSKNSSFLNPDAQEYTPSNNKASVYKLTTNDLPQDLDSHCSLPINLESSCKYPSSVSQLDTFPLTEMYVTKSKSCEAVSDSKLKNNVEWVASVKEKNPAITNESISKPTLNSDLLNSNSNFLESIDDSSNGTVDLEFKKVQTQLLNILNICFSEEKKQFHQPIASTLKNFINNSIESPIAAYIVTDAKKLEENKKSESVALEQRNVIEDLKKEISDLSKQNSSLQNVLEGSAGLQQKLTAEVARLKKSLNESNMKIENMKSEFEKKEKDMLKEKVSLVQSLTDANKFVGSLQQKNASLAEDKLKLQKFIDKLTLSLKEVDEKLNTAIASQEKKFSGKIESLQKENTELKNRTKYAELQVLYMKKSEYLKKVDAKFLEVEEVKKEMNTPSMQLWANAAGPEQMKILSTKLKNYIDELKVIKQDFIEKIDEQIQKVKNGVSLKDLMEIEMKDLPPVPTYKNTLPENLLAGMSRFNSMALPYFGASTHMPPTAVAPSVPSASSLLSSTSSLKITPPSAAVATKIIPPVSPAIATKMIPPVVPAAAKIIPPVMPVAAANIIPPVTPSANIIPSCAPSITPLSSLPSTVPPVLNANKDSKIDLVSDIDPTIQESFKSAMASINSFASSPYAVPTLDEEFDKNCVVFKHPDPIPNDVKSDHPKIPPPGLPDYLTKGLPISAPVGTRAINSVPVSVTESYKVNEEKSYAGLDTLPKLKVAPNQSTWEPEKKKTTANYSKLLSKLQEQFPSYSQEELISYVKEVRAQRQGKLSGLTIDAIISEISAIMKTKKKMPELKIQPKPAKVLVNKKLVPVPEPPKSAEPPVTKKKTAWNIDNDATQRRFSGSADDDCTICCDSMANSPYKVTCGHFFHEDCIRQWLKKNSNCPICRVLLLLPEEYPSLS